MPLGCGIFLFDRPNPMPPKAYIRRKVLVRRFGVNEQQKQQIIKMRSGGHSYKTISDRLEISINTVKSFCRRNQVVAGERKEDFSFSSSKPKKSSCEMCGANVGQISGRKKKRFCSDDCRFAWWSEKRKKQEVGLKKLCAFCRAEFLGSNERKYCSHGCYIKDRFGGGDS